MTEINGDVAKRKCGEILLGGAAAAVDVMLECNQRTPAEIPEAGVHFSMTCTTLSRLDPLFNFLPLNASFLYLNDYSA